MSDLVKRLRDLGKRREMEGIYTDQNICEAAADRIEELESAEAECERLKTLCDEQHDRIVEENGYRKIYKAENARLRKVLKACPNTACAYQAFVGPLSK